MDLVRAAAQFAAVSHHGQRRKYSDEPYIRHPARVAARVAELGVDAEVVAAGWLHDVLTKAEPGLRAELLAALGGRRRAPVIAPAPGNNRAGA